MKTSRFTAEQMAFACLQHELGTRAEEMCRKLGVTDATFYACDQVDLQCSITHCHSTAKDYQLLIARIREITQTRVHCGYRRVHVLLRREGFKDDHKRIYRLYRAEGMSLRYKRA